jgi:hypothetical protein
MTTAPDTTKTYVNLITAATMTLAGTELDCAVVQDTDSKPVRVLSRRKFQRAIGYDRTAVPKDILVQIDSNPASQPIEIPHFLSAQNLRPFLTDTILTLTTPLWFNTNSGWLAAGYRAELLPETCDVYLAARDAGVLVAH